MSTAVAGCQIQAAETEAEALGYVKGQMLRRGVSARQTPLRISACESSLMRSLLALASERRVFY